MSDESQPEPLEVHPLVEALLPGAAAGVKRPDEFVVFTGYVGRPESHEAADWVRFYLDEALQTWLLVRREDVVAHEQIKDKSMAFGRFDKIWVGKGATIKRGSGPPALEQSFLTGRFTQAGNVEASLGGGTYEPPSGLMCGAGDSHLCCTKRSRI